MTPSGCSGTRRRCCRAIGHYDAGSALRYLGFVEMGRERFDQGYERFVEAEVVFRETLGRRGSTGPRGALVAGLGAAPGAALRGGA